MYPTNPVSCVCEYAEGASDYCELPSAEQRLSGVIPLDTLPAAWWNAMWHDNNAAINQASEAIGTLIAEANTVLECAGVCPNAYCVDQLYRSIDLLRQTYGNAETAGAVKSSSSAGNVAINNDGTMTVNCYGNAALTTTAQTITGAINELNDCFTCKLSTIAACPECATGCVGTSTCYARADHQHPLTQCVCICGCCQDYVRVLGTYRRPASGVSFYPYSSCLYDVPIAVAGNGCIILGCNATCRRVVVCSQDAVGCLACTSLVVQAPNGVSFAVGGSLRSPVSSSSNYRAFGCFGPMEWYKYNHLCMCVILQDNSGGCVTNSYLCLGPFKCVYYKGGTTATYLQASTFCASCNITICGACDITYKEPVNFCCNVTFGTAISYACGLATCADLTVAGNAGICGCVTACCFSACYGDFDGYVHIGDGACISGSELCVCSGLEVCGPSCFFDDIDLGSCFLCASYFCPTDSGVIAFRDVSNFYIEGDLQVSYGSENNYGSAYIGCNTCIGNDLCVCNCVSIGEDLYVSECAEIRGGLRLSCNEGADLSMTGNAYICGCLKTGNNVCIDGNLNVDYGLCVAAGVGVGGSITACCYIRACCGVSAPEFENPVHPSYGVCFPQGIQLETITICSCHACNAVYGKTARAGDYFILDNFKYCRAGSACCYCVGAELGIIHFNSNSWKELFSFSSGTTCDYDISAHALKVVT